MHDFTLALVRESHGNYMRWMHVSPQRADVAACDRLGIVEVCPAGDKERLVTGRQWDQRAEVMRDSMIFYRNSPSIFFWEAGNTIVTPEQMVQMVALRKELDPHGGRVMGTRDNDQADANKALTPMSEYYGVMIGQAPQTDKIAGDDIFRGYSIARRDKAPLIETEDFRDEAGRNVWDDFSPPHFGFKPKSGSIGGRPVDTWHWNSETFCLAAATRYASYVRNRIDNPDPAHSKWSAYCSIYFTDSDADGRQQGSYVLRVSGKVDGVRLPKSLFFVSRVMQNEQPDIHIIGHWNYPADTKKTMYVAASALRPGGAVPEREIPRRADQALQICRYVWRPDHGRDEDGDAAKDTGYIYAFPDVVFAPGAIKAVATKGGKVVAQQEIQTAGEPKAIKLTLHTGPQGLQADGSDVALIDFEVVDAQGRRCPTDEARVDFAVTGPVVWRGGFNAAKLDTTNNLYLDTECGINRVAVRSTLTPGTITVTATREGLTVTIEAKPVKIVGGLQLAMPPTLPGLALDAGQVAPRFAARDLQLQSRLEIPPQRRAGRGGGRFRRLRLVGCRPAAHVERRGQLPRAHQPPGRRSDHLPGHRLVSEAFQAARRSRGAEDLPRIRGAQAGRAFLPQRPAGRPVREWHHRLRAGPHRAGEVRRAGQRAGGEGGQHARPTRRRPPAPSSSGRTATATRISAGSAATSGCTSWARCIKRCRSTRI
jgi:beta-galactosidase